MKGTKEMKDALRYVEISYEPPEGGLVQFFAVIVDAPSPNAALKEARGLCLRRHPGATHVQEFMQRKVTDKQAANIREQMADGSWEGWSFDREPEGGSEALARRVFSYPEDLSLIH